MLGNLHVRFGVGAGVKLPGLHHLFSLLPPPRSGALVGDGDSLTVSAPVKTGKES